MTFENLSMQNYREGTVNTDMHNVDVMTFKLLYKILGLLEVSSLL